MSCLGHSPDLNPIENTWANVKERVDVRHLSISSKKDLWEGGVGRCCQIQGFLRLH